jgi:broad specificity phosphatase PhoE
MAVTELWLIRHGESIANRAASAAEAEGAEVIHIEMRDADVPLSEDGERQAAALGSVFADNDERLRLDSTRLWVSTYLRARQTLELALDAAQLPLSPRRDERLRDRELGILDLLTRHGAQTRHPEEEERRDWLGKFSYRPPGGESWADLALRLRSVLRDIEDDAHDSGSKSLGVIVAHDSIVMLLLYVCLDWDEAELLEFASSHSVKNASLTRISRGAPGEPWQLDAFSDTTHLERAGAPVTHHSGERDDTRSEGSPEAAVIGGTA